MNTGYREKKEEFSLILPARGTVSVTAWWKGERLVRLDLSPGSERKQAVDSPLSQFLSDCLMGIKSSVQVKYQLVGTPFQVRVWEATRQIPHGEVISYGELGKRIGCASPRAVGQALKANPLPIIVPCHRVVGKDGALTGFSCGLVIKENLIYAEKFMRKDEDSSSKRQS